MAFNGSGTFVRLYSWITDAANGLFVSSTRMDADTNDIATGLSTCITKDGQTTITANIPMAGFKITGLGAGTAANDAAIIANANALSMCEFRLTLTSGTPVTTADVTGAATIYCSPYKGNHIALYSGTVWLMRSSAEFSLALGTLTNGKPYDVFCYDNAGAPTLEVLVWTNDTTRATALTLQDGVLVKTGATTRRYLGTFYTTSATTTEDSLAKRFLFNYYNRVRRPMRVTEATDTWAYTTATIRQANGAAANQLDFVIGMNEEAVTAEVQAAASNTTAGFINLSVGVGLDSTSTFTSGGIFVAAGSITSGALVNPRASLKVFPGVGRHFLSWNEYSPATGTTNWYGDNGGPTLQQSGIHGEMWG